MSNPIVKLAALVAAAATFGAGSAARADVALTTFTPGDLVVLRGGDATNPNTSTTTSQVAIYLDEYTPAGAYIGTVAAPSTGAAALTLPGVGDFQHDGVLNLSATGGQVSFAGYQAAVGTTDAFTLGGTVQPVIGTVGTSAASLNTTTVVTSYGPGSANPIIRGAYATSPTSFYTFGKYAVSGATTNGGLAYVSGTGPAATTTTVEGFADWRDVIAANGQLYGGTGSSSVGNHGPYQISAGEPTTNLGNSLSNNAQLGNYPGGQSASALALLNVPGDPAAQNGLDVLYTIGDQGTAGITKYYYNGTTWVNQTNVALNATNVVNPTGLVATLDPTIPGAVDLTVTGTNGLYTYVDTTGYNGAIPANAFTLAVAAPANEAFYGVSLAPGSAVPEPATLGLAAAAAVGLLARRRRA